ncbi:cytochrome P450 [Lentinus tigrinus ALCF2SS1-7]|uniref:Cytochrome P450 n=1 Tax=Lentinus tigrinus ALCF2SS1-6 TaxID=1328759 RepID=A0A5C2S6I6_9APHY|nr:cytochrome P450 [Lentinus tigrinus ALCF2SS1-6]RPD73607.1 cytochrome P450 [Lentinus tigrinus ALCF2SS1-7]
MAVSPLVVVAGTIAIAALWRILRQYFIRLPLDNLPGPPRSSLALGHLPELTTRDAWKAIQHLAETYGPVSVLNGVLGTRMVHLYDPKALHHILIKDGEHYPKDSAPSNDLHLLLGPGLLTTEGGQHRRQRKMLNPVFSAAHLRHMTHIFYDIAHKLRRAVEARVSKGSAEEVDVNGWMARTTLEMLGQAGLGYSFDNFVDDSTDAYGESIKLFFPSLSRVPLLGIAIPWISHYLPESAMRMILRCFPSPGVRTIVTISDTMERRSQEIINEKKAALLRGDEELVQGVGEGKDIMSVLLKDNTTASDVEKLTHEELVAQMSIFILAGMDTTSNALSRTLHILAQHPEKQQKLRAEIQEARGSSASNIGEDMAYDDLVKLPYLDAVCRETLRLYAPVNLIIRRAAKDMVLPLMWPVRGKDGTLMHEVLIPKGTAIVPNLQASNCNRALWGDDAMEWRPERWTEGLPGELEEARIPGVYSNLMTFSGGSRSCIGFKFSQLEMKIVLSVLLSKFKFELTDKPIAWNASAVTYPTMGEESTKPEMILKVTCL